MAFSESQFNSWYRKKVPMNNKNIFSSASMLFSFYEYVFQEIEQSQRHQKNEQYNCVVFFRHDFFMNMRRSRSKNPITTRKTSKRLMYCSSVNVSAGGVAV